MAERPMRGGIETPTTYSPFARSPRSATRGTGGRRGWPLGRRGRNGAAFCRRCVKTGVFCPDLLTSCSHGKNAKEESMQRRTFFQMIRCWVLMGLYIAALTMISGCDYDCKQPQTPDHV